VGEEIAFPLEQFGQRQRRCRENWYDPIYLLKQDLVKIIGDVVAGRK